MVCGASDRDVVRHSGLSSLGGKQAFANPFINHPLAHAVTLADLGDAWRSAWARRAGNAVLEAYPGDHAGGEGLAGRAFQAFTVKAVGDFVVIAVFGEVLDAGDEGGRIAHRLGAAFR